MSKKIIDTKNNADFLISRVLFDLSPTRYFYVYIYFIVFIATYVYGFYVDEYSGITPFAKSMVSASPQLKLVNDVAFVSELIIFLALILKYCFYGLQVKTKYGFRRHERQLQRLNDGNGNRYFISIIGIIFFLGVILLRYGVFVFLESGDTPRMRGMIIDSEFLLYLYMICGFLLDLYIFIFTIFILELRKHI
ncbi:MAG: hypothetical protein RR487_03020 [Acinetobacter sp.]